MDQYRDVFIYHIFYRLSAIDLTRMRQVSKFFGELIKKEVVLDKLVGWMNDIWDESFGDNVGEFKKIVGENEYIVLWDIGKGDKLDIEIIGYDEAVYYEKDDNVMRYEDEEEEDINNEKEYVSNNDNMPNNEEYYDSDSESYYDSRDYYDSDNGHNIIIILMLNKFHDFMQENGYENFRIGGHCKTRIFGSYERGESGCCGIYVEWFTNNCGMEKYLSKNQILSSRNSYSICKETGREIIMVPGLL